MKLNTEEPIDEPATEEPSYSVSSNVPLNVKSSKVAGENGGLTIRIPKPQTPKVELTKKQLKIAGVVIVLLVSLGSGFLGGYLGAVHRENSNLGTLSSQKKIVTNESELIGEIAKTVGPSVVSVDVISQSQPSSGLFGLDSGSQQQESAGTGIIISSDGLIVTNRHVVPAGTTSVSVTLSDGTELNNVQVVGRTNDSDSLDIAFLKITDAKGHKLTPAVIGDSSKVQVGDAVVAIGNALGQFQNTVTSGIISGFGRSVQAGDSSGQQTSENLSDLFQTDAAINEGNSGGPLVNLNGQVIGINTAIASNSQNIGFTIPINDVTGLIKQVEATGKLVRPYLGVRYVSLTPDVASQYALSVTAGAFVAPSTDPTNPSIVAGSPADKAGIMENDVITQVDGNTIDQTHSLTSVIDQHAVGDMLNLTVVRGGKTLHVSAALAAEPTS